MDSIRIFFKKQPPHRISILILLCGVLIVLLISLACNAPASEDELKDTQTALNIQATLLAENANLENPPQTQVVQPSATQTTAAAPEPPTATYTHTPDQPDLPASLTPTLTETVRPTAPLPSETAEPLVAASLDDLIKGSRILLFEDITSIYMSRYVKEALDNMGLSQNYVDVKDAVGHFKTQLLSGTDWDLIITAVEARSNVQGEFFVYLNDQLNSGTSVIIEHWNLDDLAGGQAAIILSRCGLRISDWYDPPSTNRSIWWLQGDHPIFHVPNEGMSLSNYSIQWYGDVGDLMRTEPGSNATLLAGTFAQYKDSNATLATCLDDRLILQTFSSHDYRQGDVVQLWQNYIYNALRAHFEYMGDL